MKPIKALAYASLLFLSTTTVFSYDVVDRYRLIDDQLKTEDMLRPLGHDFLIDMSVAMNKNAQSLIKDISDAGKAIDPTTAASDVLTKYDKTEQTVKVDFTLGIPLFSFSAWEVKIRPNFRAYADLGLNLGIRSDILTVADLVNLFPSDIPQDLKTFIGTLVPTNDVIIECNNSVTLSASTKAFCATQPTGKYIIPSLTTAVPNLSLFGKLDGKVGFFNDYTYQDHFFGVFNLYYLSRTDLFQRITKDMIKTGSAIEFPKTKNTESTLQVDYRLGYKNDNYKVFASLEELKIATLKQRSVGSKELAYGYKALMRVHADATYKFSVVTLNPFIGLHKRSGYGLSEGVYVGADAGAYLWGDRLGLQLRGMFDKEYITISPRMKLWLMQLEYSLKTPVKKMDGDVNLSAINSIDLRFFF